MEGWGAAPAPSSTPCYKVRWRGQDRWDGGDTFGTCSRERGHSPEPRAHSGAEDSEVQLAMPWGLVTGGIPGPLPTPVTLLHPLGKSNLMGLAQEPTCCPGGEQREGELGWHHHHRCINGDIPWHGTGMSQQTWGGQPPMKVTSSCTKDANANTHP